jgi:2-polyprenyl-6-methoxyphenol hydroxylase-like FAD-dependent oxidoreductase
MSKIDVLIVGAGPSGLMMAAELARYGIECRIIDKAPLPTTQSKALAIQARTLEVFQHLGIIDQFLSQGLKIHSANMISQRRPLAHFSFAHLDTPYPFVLSLEQSKTERILDEHLSSFGLHVERELELISFVQENGKVQATIRNNHNGKEEHIQARFLIGCDGAHSFVRKNLDTSFKGKTFSDIFSLADLHLDWSYPDHELFAFLEPKGVMAAFPLPAKKRYRLIFRLERCRSALKNKPSSKNALIAFQEIPSPTVEEVQEILTQYVGKDVKLYDPIWMTNFHINSRLTKHYQSGREVFLVGDAAHIHSPVGGQGMNTGLQDAFNLAWKLAFVIHKKADPILLDSYEIEREFVGRILLKATERASFMATLRNPIGVFLRNHIIPWAAKSSRVQRRITTATSQLAIRYPKSNSLGSKAGMRAPNAPVYHNGQETDLFYLWAKRTSYQVLIFCGLQPNPEQIESFYALALSFYNKFAYGVIFIMHTPMPQKNLEIIFVEDPSGKAHQTYDATQSAIYIICPDDYIDYCQTPIEIDSLKKRFLNFRI